MVHNVDDMVEVSTAHKVFQLVAIPGTALIRYDQKAPDVVPAR